MFKFLKTWLTSSPTTPLLAVRLGVDAFEDRLAPARVMVYGQGHQGTSNGAGSAVPTKDVVAEGKLGNFEIQDLMSRYNQPEQ